MNKEQKIKELEYKIELLSGRAKDNAPIVKKLKRKLRALSK